MQFSYGAAFLFNIKKIGDILKLHELKLYFKHKHQDLPANLLDWKLTPNAYIYTIITQGVQTTYTHSEPNMNLPKL